MELNTARITERETQRDFSYCDGKQGLWQSLSRKQSQSSLRKFLLRSGNRLAQWAHRWFLQLC